MPIPVHIICGMCGSLDIKFNIERYEDGMSGCGVTLSCDNCRTLTGVEEINEWKDEEDKRKRFGR